MPKIENGSQWIRQLVTTALPLVLISAAPQVVKSYNHEPQSPINSPETQVLAPTQINLVDTLVRGSQIFGINRLSIVTNPDDSTRWSIVSGQFEGDTLVLKQIHKPNVPIYELTGDDQFDIAIGDDVKGVYTNDGGKTWNPIAPFGESGQNIQTLGAVVLPGEHQAIAQIQIDSDSRPDFRVIDRTGKVAVLSAQTIPSKAQSFATPAFKTAQGHVVYSNYEPTDSVNGPKNSIIVNKITKDGVTQSLIQIDDPDSTKMEIISSDISVNGEINLVLSPKTTNQTKNPTRVIRYNTSTGVKTEIPTIQPSSPFNSFMRPAGVIDNTLSAVSDQELTCVLKATIQPISDTNFTEDTQISCFSNTKPQLRKIYNDLGDWRDGNAKLAFMDNNGQKSIVVAYQDRSVVTKTIGDLTKPDHLPWKKAVFAPPAHQYFIPVGGNIPLK